MKKIVLLLFTFIIALPVLAKDDSKEEPIQHYKIADVTSMEEAKSIFIRNTSEIKSKKKLNPLELEQIHVITYSLEKSIAYFVENLTGDGQFIAKEIALSVESIHVDSENNRPKKTREHLNNYFNLADKFLSGDNF